MNFKEYLELNEEVELFDEIIGLDENALAPVKFVGGAATNLGSQLLRGAGNVVGGLTRTALGAARTGAGALQAAGGGFRPGWENIKKGASSAASGMGQALTGTAQAVASPVSAVLRGAQASSEPLTPRSFSDDRNWLQKTFGLNAWDDNEPRPIRSPKDTEWHRLVRAYKSTEDKIERAKILEKLRELDPEKYIQAKRIGRKMKDERRIRRFFADLEKRGELGTVS